MILHGTLPHWVYVWAFVAVAVPWDMFSYVDSARLPDRVVQDADSKVLWGASLLVFYSLAGIKAPRTRQKRTKHYNSI